MTILFNESIKRFVNYHNLNLSSSDKKNMIKVDHTAMPHVIFSSPQVAGVGKTEQQLKKQNKIKYLKSIYSYIETGMGLAIEDRQGFVKFLVDKENWKILGCHILGTEASTLIHEVLVAMRTGDGTIDSISDTIHIHPVLSEVVERAASGIDEWHIFFYHSKRISYILKCCNIWGIYNYSWND